MVADLGRVRSCLEQNSRQLLEPGCRCLMQRGVASSLRPVDVSTLGDQNARGLAIAAQSDTRMQWLVMHGIARELVYLRSVDQQQRRGLWSTKCGRQVKWRPAVARGLLNHHCILLQQSLDADAIPNGGCFKYVQIGQAGEQEVPDQRLPAINAPQKSRDALGVSACNKRWIFFCDGGDFCRFAAADQVEKALAHRLRLASPFEDLSDVVSATEAANTVSLDPLVTEPGLVRLE